MPLPACRYLKGDTNCFSRRTRQSELVVFWKAFVSWPQMKHAALHIESRCEIHVGPLPSVGILRDLLSSAVVSRFLACTTNEGCLCRVHAPMRWIQMKDLVDFCLFQFACVSKDSNMFNSWGTPDFLVLSLIRPATRSARTLTFL